jgi:hypothetical protein
MTGQPLYGIAEGIQYSVDLTVDHLNTHESENLARICARSSEAGRLNLMRRLNTPFILSVGAVKNPTAETITSFPTSSDQQVYVSWLHNSVRRAYFVSSFQRAASQTDALRAFLRPDFNYITSAVIEGAETASITPRGDSGKVRIIKYESRTVECDVEALTEGYLILLDSYYPGWRAYVDGIPVEIMRANYAFRAVRLSPGRHRVEFRYEPVSFYAGLTVSCVTLIVGLILVGYSVKRKSE